MGNPAARIGDMHVCPMVTPGLPPIPHVGGPVTGPGCPTVMIGGMPAAVMGDMCVCVGPPDSIILGSTGVFFGGKPAARMGDSCAHGGTIILGCPTVLVGETGSGSASPPATMLTAVQLKAMGPTNALAQGIMNAAVTGDMYVAPPIPPVKEKPAPVAIEKSTLACTLLDETGKPMDNTRYEVELPDGSKRTGTTDSQGKIMLSGIPAGTCKVGFPDLHADEWY